ncbi:hypothetical protein ARMSODRAFT_1019590 [Armillaria solidipes]|uniref:Uncharacterized protein n=1 Tax=Armillaria solidipes TaxID=1076256 RepID=A0A2H3BV60_9AGAR|nr:hypothetical protein ARMSODRAFT_1019590 [Armillaria solidipes]
MVREFEDEQKDGRAVHLYYTQQSRITLSGDDRDFAPIWDTENDHQAQGPLSATYLGYACFLVNLQSVGSPQRSARVLVDPVFSGSCSSAQFSARRGTGNHHASLRIYQSWMYSLFL